MLIFREKFNFYLKRLLNERRELIKRLIDENTHETIKSNLNDLYNELNVLLKSAADKASEDLTKLIITKQIKIEPWWTNELIFLNKESKRLHMEYRRTGKLSFQIESDITQSRFRRLHREQYQKFRHRVSKNY
jgi:hypothetical protein